MSLTPQEEYVEAGYFADADYVGGVALVVVGISPYVVEDYIEAGYFVPGGSFASLTATLELAIQFGEATINSSSTMNCDVERILQFSSNLASEFTAQHTEGAGFDIGFDVDVEFTGEAVFTSTSTMSVTPSKILSATANISGAFNTVMTVVATKTGETLAGVVSSMTTSAELIADSSGLLEYFANLNAQGDRSRSATTVQSSNFQISSSAGVSYQGASEVVCNSSLTSIVDSVIFSDSTTINSVSALTANAIEYRLRSNDLTPGQRPHYPSSIAPFTSFSTDKVLGSHSLQTYGSTTLGNRTWVTYTISNDDMILPNSGSNATQVEFWLKGVNEVRLHDTSSVTNWFIVKDAQRNILAYTDVTNNSDNSRLLGTGTTGFDHIVVRWNRSTMAMWVNGVRSDYYAGTQDRSPTTTSNLRLSINRNPDYFSGQTWGSSQLDELRVLTGTETELNSALGYTVASTTITVPSSEFTNTVNTRILLHFNNSYLDDDVGVQLFTSNSTAISTVTTSGGVNGFISADLSTNISLSSSAGIIKNVDSTLNSVFDLSSAGLRIKSAVANLNSEFTSTATSLKYAGADASLSVVASVVSSVGVVFQGAMIADSIASSLTAAGRVGDFFANADVSTTLTSAVVVVRGANTSLNSEFTSEINPNYIRGANSTGASVTTAVASIVTIKHYTADLNSVSGLTATVGEITQGTATLNSNSSISCTASRLSVEVANLGTISSISVVPNSISSGTVQLNIFSETVALAGVAYEASVEMSGFTAIISINKILHVDQYIYSVPKETRSFSIPKETRSYAIDRELRSYSIKGT